VRAVLAARVKKATRNLSFSFTANAMKFKNPALSLRARKNGAPGKAKGKRLKANGNG
jgi:hypothetical protein